MFEKVINHKWLTLYYANTRLACAAILFFLTKLLAKEKYFQLRISCK